MTRLLLMISAIILATSAGYASGDSCEQMFSPAAIDALTGGTTTTVDLLLADLAIHGEKAMREEWTPDYQVHVVWPDVVKASRKNGLSKTDIATLQHALARELKLLDPSLRLTGARLLLLDWENNWFSRLKQRSKEPLIVATARSAALDTLHATDPIMATRFFKEYLDDSKVSDDMRLYVIREMLNTVSYSWGNPRYPIMDALPEKLLPIAYEVIRISAKVAYRIQKPKYPANSWSGRVDAHAWADTNGLVKALSRAQMRLGFTKYERRAYWEIKFFHDNLEPWSIIKY